MILSSFVKTTNAANAIVEIPTILFTSVPPVVKSVQILIK